METILEFALMLFWDLIKTLALQWIIDYFKELWASNKNIGDFQYSF